MNAAVQVYSLPAVEEKIYCCFWDAFFFSISLASKITYVNKNEILFGNKAK